MQTKNTEKSQNIHLNDKKVSKGDKTKFRKVIKGLNSHTLVVER
jgi:hypothetical protein